MGVLLTILLASALHFLGSIGSPPPQAPLVAESHSGRWAVVARVESSSVEFALVDRRNGTELWTFPGAYPYALSAFEGSNIDSMVAFSPRDDRLAVGGTSLSEYDVQSHRLLWRRDGLRVNAVAYSPDGNTIIAGGALPIVAAFASRSGLERWHADHGSIVISVAVDPRAAIAASGSDGGGVRLWQLGSGAELPHLRIPHLGPGTHMQAALDGYLAHEGRVLDLGFTSDGTLITGGGDGSFRLWDPLRGRMLTERICPQAVTSIAIGNAGAAASCFESGPAIFDPQTLRVRDYFAQDNGGTAHLWTVPNGWLVLGGDGTLKRWDGSTFGIRTLSGTVQSAALAPGGGFLAYTYGDRIIHVASVPSGEDAAQISGVASAPYRCCFGRSVIALGLTRDAVIADTYTSAGFVDHHGAYDGTLRMWDLHGHALASFRGVTASQIAPIDGGRKLIVTSPAMTDTPWTATLVDLGTGSVAVWQPKQTVMDRLTSLDLFNSAAPGYDDGATLFVETQQSDRRVLVERELPSGRIVRTFEHVFSAETHGIVQDRQTGDIAVLGGLDGLVVLAPRGSIISHNADALGSKHLAGMDASGGVVALLTQPQADGCDGNYHVHVLSERTGREIDSISRPYCAQNIQLSDDARVLAVQTARGVDLWTVR